MKEFWVGADPGGKKGYGLAFLYACGEVRCDTVSTVDEAFDQIIREGEPLGIGIDAPMWWSSGQGGGRKADERIRKTCSVDPRRVLAVNALRGAALVGGAMLASRIREYFPCTRITEAHPTALLDALGLERDYEGFARRFNIPGSFIDRTGTHEKDAFVCAVCAREGFKRHWTTDLALQRHESEQDPFSYWLAPMHYFWPGCP